MMGDKNTKGAAIPLGLVAPGVNKGSLASDLNAQRYKISREEFPSIVLLASCL